MPEVSQAYLDALVSERDHLSEIVECLTNFTLRCGEVARTGEDPQQDLIAQAMHARLADLVLAHLRTTEATDN